MTELFDEIETNGMRIEAVARLASDWFARHLAGTGAPEPALHNT